MSIVITNIANSEITFGVQKGTSVKVFPAAVTLLKFDGAPSGLTRKITKLWEAGKLTDGAVVRSITSDFRPHPGYEEQLRLEGQCPGQYFIRAEFLDRSFVELIEEQTVYQS